MDARTRVIRRDNGCGDVAIAAAVVVILISVIGSSSSNRGRVCCWCCCCKAVKVSCLQFLNELCSGEPSIGCLVVIGWMLLFAAVVAATIRYMFSSGIGEFVVVVVVAVFGGLDFFHIL